MGGNVIFTIDRSERKYDVIWIVTVISEIVCNREFETGAVF